MTYADVVCDLGVGCDETGVCYAMVHAEPERCGQRVVSRINVIPFPARAPAPTAMTYKPAHGGYPTPTKDKQ